jgi:3-methyl-2-oxobutanoate hydroxymethyltransferase
MNILDFQRKKNQEKKIVMLTCYDYFSARIIDTTAIDCVLVGDSAGMIMHGYPNTTLVTIDDMVAHTKAVARGTTKFIITDMPFFSYRKGLNSSCDAVVKLIQAGAQAVKIEGAHGNSSLIEHLVTSGIPVMGHIGMTPQAIHQLGGNRVQGKNEACAKDLLSQAKMLQQAGCFALVIECVPWSLAKQITENLSIPTIGIGAGPYTSGQVLVLQDLLGLQTELTPKFVKHYLDGATLFKEAIEKCVDEVTSSDYPSVSEHSYS